jgi:hypothetical protein
MQVIAMPSFAKFSKLIAEKWALASPERLSAIASLQPQRIYIENVRAALSTTSWLARMVCETAVRRGVLVKGIHVLCPNGAVAASAWAEVDLPPRVTCWKEIDGDLEPVECPTSDLAKLEFYSVPGTVREPNA